MKYIFILIFIVVPVISFAQSKPTYRQYKQELEQRKLNFEKNPAYAIQNAGINLQKAATLQNGGLVLSVLGGGVLALASFGDAKGRTIAVAAGGTMSIVGLVLEVIGNNKVRRAGEYLEHSRITASANGLSFNF